MPSGNRSLLVATGLAAIGLSLSVAYLFAELIAVALPGRIDPLSFAVLTVALALGFGYGSYRTGTTQLLRSLDASPVPRSAAPDLHRRLARLTDRMTVDDPRLYVTELDAPNALAIGGRGTGVIVLDARLPHLLRPEELDAILAHELAHLEGYDGLLQTLAGSLVQTIAGFVFVLALPIALLLALARRILTHLSGHHPRPLLAQFTHTYYRTAQLVVIVLLGFTLALRAHSRHRELDADDRAVAITGDPLALARALHRIQLASDPYRGRWASLFIHAQDDTGLTRLLDTHPDMDHRIHRLRQMAGAHDHIPIRIT